MNIAGLLLAIILLALSPADARQHLEIDGYYADCGVITEEPADVVVVTMQSGNQFAFENEDRDWFVGDIVTLVFNDKGTDEVYDDEIVDCRYSGWVSDEEIKSWVKRGDFYE